MAGLFTLRIFAKNLLRQIAEGYYLYFTAYKTAALKYTTEMPERVLRKSVTLDLFRMVSRQHNGLLVEFQGLFLFKDNT